MSEKISIREGYVTVPGGDVWYKIVGSGGGLPLVTVHGGPGATHDYLEPLEELADERPVVFYDQLGSGKSDKPEDPALWHNDRFVEELARLLDTLGFPRVHLLGQSWGTIFVTEYALRTPARVAALVLASPCLSVPRYAAGAEALRAALPADVRAVLDQHESAGTTDSEEYEAASMAFYQRHLCRLEEWPDYILRSFTQLNQSISTQMAGPTEFVVTGIHKDYDVTPRLGELRMPTLFTCGRFDETRPEETAWYHSLVPGSELAIFEESSHVAHAEEKERYLQTVRGFLRRAEDKV